MASEKVTALLEEIKAMSVLELSELVHAVEEEFGVSAAAAVAVAAPATAALPLLKKRPSLTSFLLKSAIRKSRLSRLFVNSPALASAKQKRLLTALPRPSKKLCRKKKLKLQKQSLKKSAQKSNSNKFVCNAKHPVQTDRVFFCAFM